MERGMQRGMQRCLIANKSFQILCACKQKPAADRKSLRQVLSFDTLT